MLTTTSNRFETVFKSLIAMFVFFLLTDPAFAASDGTTTTSTTQPTTGFETVICNALAIVQGTVGKGIAAFAIIFIGLSLFLGKVSWGVAISTALGIAAIFSASSVVDALGGDGNDCEGYSSFSDL